MKRLVSIACRWLKRALLAGVITFVIALIVFVIAWFAFPFPSHQLDRWPASPRVVDRRGEPMLQLVGIDDQWRMPIALSPGRNSVQRSGHITTLATQRWRAPFELSGKPWVIMDAHHN